MVVSSVHGVGFGSSGDRNFSHELLYSEEPEPPSRMDESKFQILMVKSPLFDSNDYDDRCKTAMLGRFHCPGVQDLDGNELQERCSSRQMARYDI